MSKKHRSLRGEPQCKEREIRRNALRASVGKILRPQFEQLEPRHLLAADPWTWFESFEEVPRIDFESLARVDRPLPPGVAGPQEPSTGEWVLQLSDVAVDNITQITDVDELIRDVAAGVEFTLISGLGGEGLVLVRGQGESRAAIESSLTANEFVDLFSLNQLISGQQVLPDDPEFVAGLLPGLELVDAKNAWDLSVGSSRTVVGVVDTGIDPTHPDLYLNMWLNQGELPEKYLDEDGNKLVDLDGDGLITFYDLNNATRLTSAPYTLTEGGFANGPNAEFVKDLNNNGRIDAADLLADANWADGRDTDNNGFFDDFFGVNFRAGANDPLPASDPSDPLGHGTHVAGTIGAIGGNGTGAVGVNWHASLMSLRILDNNNQGDSGAAITAINYARQMRERLATDSENRVTEGANVKVLNNSWGQPGGYEASLETAIGDTADSGILFVAAAGNGNILGNGVDNDRTPFYPASYDSPNIIAVSASNASDNLATFSNFGKTSVDLLAPGVGIRSTLPGGGYGSANGTSMASPHVAGTAALIWSAFPEASVDEVTQAILSSVTPVSGASNIVSTSGRLNSNAAINADVFAPAARLIDKPNITTSGGTTTEFTIEYSHRSGIDITTLGDDDLIVTRQWGPADQFVATLEPGSIATTPTTATATYTVVAPGGTWDPLDFGDYLISTATGMVTSQVGNQTSEAREVGSFNVRIKDDPSVIYVDTFTDSLAEGSLRSAIIAANAAAPAERTIILDTGEYTIDIPAVVDPASTFGTSLETLSISNPGGWSNESTGDFDVLGNVTIVGDTNDETVIDAQGLDRVFKVHSAASLGLTRLTIQNGVSPVNQGGGGILSLGQLDLQLVIARKNVALGPDEANPIGGGAIAAWGGTASLNQSWLTENEANAGGGIYYGYAASGEVQRSTLSGNEGGGLDSHSSADLSVENSTFSANLGGRGAIANGDPLIANGSSFSPSVTGDGRYVTFGSGASNLVPGDNNGASDIFVHDRTTGSIERVSVSDDGAEANRGSFSPSMSDDGRYVTFGSRANNLVPRDNNDDAAFDTESGNDVFVYDRDSGTIERVSVSDAGAEANHGSDSPALSGDGRYVAFRSRANNLVPGDNNNARDIFVYDRTAETIERVSVSDAGTEADADSFSPSLSDDGRYVTFMSDASNLVPGDTNGQTDIFVYDRTAGTIERVNVSDDGTQANGESDFTSLSGDGRYVTFHSSASNLVPGDTNDERDIFVYDRTAGTIERVSVSGDGTQANSDSHSPSISGNGRYVTFESRASNLVPGDTNGGGDDIFVYDRTTGTIERVNVSDDGTQANQESDSPFLSGDGRYVTFRSRASTLVPGDANDQYDIFVHDRTAETIDAVTIEEIESVIDVRHVTVAFHPSISSGSVIRGDVRVENSLLAANQVFADLEARAASLSSNNNILSETPQSDLITSLQRLGSLPPVHRPTLGNPAINAALPAGNPDPDQLNQIRDDAADVGSVEATKASVTGRVYVDINRDGVFDADEPGLPGINIAVAGTTTSSLIRSADASGALNLVGLEPDQYEFTVQLDPDAPWSVFLPPIESIRNGSVQGNGFSRSPSLSDDGRYVTFQSDASNLVPGDTNNDSDIFDYDRTTGTIQRVSVTDFGTQSNNSSFSPFLSGDGGSVTFVSSASNLVPGDTSGVTDIFVYDHIFQRIERVNVSDAGAEANDFSFNPSLSGDGRFVAFDSGASNLVPGDTNNASDIFVYDRATGTIERVSVSDDGAQANGSSESPSLSDSGRYVTFESNASNLVPGDTNFRTDIFVYDRANGAIERVSVSDDGTQANGFGSDSPGSFSPSLSDDGRHVTFESDASNLVPGDTNGRTDIFVYDRGTGTIERVSVSDAGAEANGSSDSPFPIGAPSLSGDGRYVTFRSTASNLVPGDTNDQPDIFVYDRTAGTIARVSVSNAGAEANGESGSPFLSGDGRYVTFDSEASNLVPGDTNGTLDIFITHNPFAEPSVTRELLAGEIVSDLNFGLLPDPGTISGRVFEDVIENGIYDENEPVVVEATVFLDLNDNRILDATEPFTTPSGEGFFEFTGVDAFRSYTIAAQLPAGFEQIGPGAEEDFVWSIFLPPGSDIRDRDFALRRVSSTGQATSSAVSGRLYEERDGLAGFTAGDVPIVGREVFLDASNFGVRDVDEPRELTDANGMYSFTELSARNVAVSTTLDPTLVHVSPLGSDFQLTRHPLFPTVQPFGNPQSIGSGDFNGDGFDDVAVALGEGNLLSIRLNDGSGGFLPDQININLGQPGSGPTSMVIGQFDDNPQLDAALTANFAGNVTVLLNFNPATNTFDSTSYVAVGTEPLDLASGQFAGDNKPDLVVVNQADNTIQLLTNNGAGAFAAGTAVPSGGNTSSSIVAGRFTGDAFEDVAVVHSSPSDSTPSGGVTVLAGDGSGGLTLRPEYYPVGALPIDSVTADFDEDGLADLAVANFSSNSISILLGQANGTFRVQTAILGTASGAFDIAIGDVDNDGDVDLIAGNLRDRNISIFRNDGPDPTTGEVRFQPLENIGLGQFSLAQRMPLVIANFDNDTSGPGGTGTVDIVTIPQLTDTLHVLKNRLVDGAHRVALTGLNVISGVDFIIKPAILPPSFDVIGNPLGIFEDAAQQSVSVTGVTKGRMTGPELQFTVTSDNPSLIPSPGLISFSGGTSTAFTYAAAPNSNGTAVLTVRATDAGADELFGGQDDGIFERSFTVTVVAVNDPPVFDVVPEASARQTDGATTVTDFLTGIGNGGGSDEESQTRNPLQVTATDPSFFTSQPTIDAAGTLTFTPSPNRSGSVPVTVTLQDSGGRANGGVDTTTKTFLVTIAPVNDPPAFTLMANPNQSVLQTAGPQTVNDFVTSFLPGGGSDETSQTVSDYIVSVDTPGIFAVLPDVSNSGVLTFTPAIDRSGVATVSVQVRDSGGQADGGSDLSGAQTFLISVEETPDTTQPVPVISTPGIDALTNQTAFTVEIDFGEPVTDFSLSDVTVSSGTTATFSDHGGGIYSFHYSGSDGSVSFEIAADVAADLSGNPNVAAQPWTRTIDSQGMTPTLSSIESNPSKAASFDVVIDFTEAVTGFTLMDLTVLGGAASNLAPRDLSTGEYDVTITPSADGIVAVLLPANSVKDAAGNGNLPAEPFVRTIDRTAPVPVLSTDQPAMTNKTTFDVTADFGESVTWLQQSSLVVSGALASAPQRISDQRYSFTITEATGAVEISLAADSASDAAGNFNVGSNTISVSVDTSTIVPFLATTAPSIVTGDTFDISIDFGKAVLGFGIHDVLVSGAIASDLIVVDESVGTYAVTITPVSDGVVNVTVPAAAAADVAGNANETSNSIVRQIDRTAPSATLAFLASVPGRTSREVQIAFSEAVSGFEPDDLVVNGGVVGSLVRNLNDRVYSVLVDPIADGDVTVDLPADRVQDSAGLGNTAATGIVITVDISRPSPTITTAPSTVVGEFEIAITFDESVTGLAANDFQVSNGILSNLSGEGDAYTATVTALVEGDVTISLPEERVSDSAGNRNIDSNLLTVTHRFVDSIVLQGDGEVIDMTAHDETILSTVETIDIRGAGDNSIVLDAEKITRLTPNQTLRVIANRGDAVTFDDGWVFESVQIVDEMLQRVFTNGPATILLVGPDGWTHPILSADVDGNGSVTPRDALRVINALERGRVFDDSDFLVDPATVDLNAFAFYDVNGDLRLTVLDALVVINELARLESESEGERVAVSLVHPLPWAAGERGPIADNEDRRVHITQNKSDVLLSGENAEASMQATYRLGNSLSQSLYSGDVERTTDDDRSDVFEPIDQAFEMVHVWHELDR
ncbi:MAG: S8 family serine peptidase [Phycisphaera sp. RhM]|nr:S8 family serine peptidase [Phycisphaera sp. RhM]